MNKLSPLQERLLDEQIAEFTDMVLSDGNKDMELISDQIEVAKMQKAILRMKMAAGLAKPSLVARTRIRTKLFLEWQKSKQSRVSMFQSLIRGITLRPLLAGALGLLFVSVLAVLFRTTEVPLTGTALGEQNWLPVFTILGIILIAILLWFNRRS